MPFFDKMKEQASQVAQKAQEAGKAGQAKIEQAQAKRERDALLRRLGAAAYAQHTGESEGAENADELIAEIAKHEAEHGPLSSDDADTQATGAPASDAPASAPASDAPAGDFKL